MIPLIWLEVSARLPIFPNDAECVSFSLSQLADPRNADIL